MDKQIDSSHEEKEPELIEQSRENLMKDGIFNEVIEGVSRQLSQELREKADKRNCGFDEAE